MTAIGQGKHVYCEKPLTQTIEQAQLVADAAAKAGVATQMGIRGQASEGMRRIQEMIADGAIGDVREVHLWTNRPTQKHGWAQGIDRPKEAHAIPASLDWDLWLGPAPTRPYHPAYHPFKWRGWWDFGTGALGDMGCHILDVAFRALKLGYPETVHAVSTPVNKETFPLGSIVTYEFPKRGSLPPVTLTWYDGGLKPERPDELEDGRKMPDGGVLFIGDKAKMLEGRIIPESKMGEYTPAPKTLPRSPGHYVEWVEACKGGKSAGANFDYSSLLTQVVLMGNVALRPELRKILNQQKLKWDPKKKQFSNVPKANEFLSLPVRQGWEL